MSCNAQMICEKQGGDVSDAQSGDVQASNVLPPSCMKLPMTCGASGNESCCDSPLVTGDTYYRSYDLAGDSYSGNMNYPATVRDFWLDKYEVTVGRFRAFVEAGMGTQSSPPMPNAGAHANIAGSGWDVNWNTNLPTNKAALISNLNCEPYSTWTDEPLGNEHRPINCITWYEAMAFCAWDGGYLPTEAEWNYAAAGGREQRTYPWSNPAGSTAHDPLHASYKENSQCLGDEGEQAACNLDDLVEVGTKSSGVGKWGQIDLAGNVWEWVLDSAHTPYVFTNCQDCADLTTATNRVFRGGTFNDEHVKEGHDSLRAGYRGAYPPDQTGNGVGIRCARSAQ